ncbi:hypothetical protein B0H14DRAFT_2963403 [Mycena olivaceomarginata]|nr:hypothetical protein B0H14DRAFT_2963403 [Mycena olivaceomarginata]
MPKTREKKRPACVRCKAKKLKCDRADPCAHCGNKKAECTYPDYTTRKKKPPHDVHPQIIVRPQIIDSLNMRIVELTGRLELLENALHSWTSSMSYLQDTAANQESGFSSIADSWELRSDDFSTEAGSSSWDLSTLFPMQT